MPSTLAFASVALHEEISLSYPNTIAQVKERRSEQNSSVSYGYNKYVLAVTDDQQAQQPMSGSVNAQNVLITGGIFVGF